MVKRSLHIYIIQIFSLTNLKNKIILKKDEFVKRFILAIVIKFITIDLFKSEFYKFLSLSSQSGFLFKIKNLLVCFLNSTIFISFFSFLPSSPSCQNTLLLLSKPLQIQLQASFPPLSQSVGSSLPLHYPTDLLALRFRHQSSRCPAYALTAQLVI